MKEDRGNHSTKNIVGWLIAGAIWMLALILFCIAIMEGIKITDKNERTGYIGTENTSKFNDLNYEFEREGTEGNIETDVGKGYEEKRAEIGKRLEVSSITESKICTMSVMQEDSDSVTVKASVVPENAEIELSWSITDANGYATSRSEKYIQMTIAEDERSVTLKKVQDFGEVFLLNVSDNKDPSVNATCTLNCRALVQSIREMEIGYIDSKDSLKTQSIKCSSEDSSTNMGDYELRDVMIGRENDSSEYSIYFKLQKEDIIRRTGTKEHEVKIDIILSLGDDLLWDHFGGKEYVFPSRHLEVSDRGEYYYADFNLDGELWNSLFSECSDFSYDYEGIARECRRDKLYECLYCEIEINCSDETCSDCYSPYFFLYVEFSEENFTDLYAE